MRRKIAVRRAIAGLVAIAGIGLALPSSPAGADGTETLGPPSIPIATGSGVVTEGTGLFVQPSTVNIAVPAHATVKQTLLYWQGEHRGAPDDTILVNGTEVRGTQIGGPTVFYGDVRSTSFRADVTDRGFIQPGANSVSLSGLAFDVGNNGASFVVVFDDGSGIKEVGVRDGNDNAFKGFEGNLQTTVPQTFPVNPAAEDREAQIDLIVGSVDSNRGSLVRITSGGSVFTSTNLLGNTDDREWDDVTVPFTIPAGATDVTIEVISEDVDGKAAASLTWVAAVLSQPDLCPASDVPAQTKGSAFAVDARVLGVVKVDKLASVASALPGGPASDAEKPLTVSVPGLVSAKVLATASNSKLNPSTTTSSATLADVSLLSGLVKASAIKAVSQSNASTQGASYGSPGATIVGLKVGGASVNVAPNTKVAVKLLGLITIAELYVMEETGTSSFADGASKASHSMNALRLVLLKSFLGFPAGATVTLSHADSEAQSPISGCPDAKTVSGEAFTAYVDGNLAGQDLVDVKVGDAVLPSVGGSDFDGVFVNIPGVATSATAANTTSGSLDPHPNATSRSVVQYANVLNGLVTARLLDVKASSSANGMVAGTSFATRFVDLRVGGKTIVVDGDVAPNTYLVVDLGHLGYVSVVLNEQMSSSTGGTDTEGTVNAVHARVYTLGGLLTGEVIIASAHSDAHASR